MRSQAYKSLASEKLDEEELQPYFDDAVKLFGQSSTGTKLNAKDKKGGDKNHPSQSLSFIALYFENVVSGENILFRDFECMCQTYKNRLSFINQFRKIFHYYFEDPKCPNVTKDTNMVTGDAFWQFLTLLCPNFDISIVNLAIVLLHICNSSSKKTNHPKNTDFKNNIGAREKIGQKDETESAKNCVSISQSIFDFQEVAEMTFKILLVWDILQSFLKLFDEHEALKNEIETQDEEKQEDIVKVSMSNIIGDLIEFQRKYKFRHEQCDQILQRFLAKDDLKFLSVQQVCLTVVDFDIA